MKNIIEEYGISVLMLVVGTAILAGIVQALSMVTGG